MEWRHPSRSAFVPLRFAMDGSTPTTWIIQPIGRHTSRTSWTGSSTGHSSPRTSARMTERPTRTGFWAILARCGTRDHGPTPVQSSLRYRHPSARPRRGRRHCLRGPREVWRNQGEAGRRLRTRNNRASASGTRQGERTNAVPSRRTAGLNDCASPITRCTRHSRGRLRSQRRPCPGGHQAKEAESTGCCLHHAWRALWNDRQPSQSEEEVEEGKTSGGCQVYAARHVLVSR